MTTVHNEQRSRRSRLQRGLTLIEMLVAIAIGLVVTLAVTSVLTFGEAHKRSTTSTNDMGQTGSFAIYQLDRAARSAGSGLVQSITRGLLGCKLTVGSILPRATAFPAPFAGFLPGAGGTANLRVAPLLIAKSQSQSGSDVLVIMRGNGSAGGVPRRVADPGTDTLLIPENAVGIAPDEVLILSQDGTSDCLMEQVESVSGNQLTLGGTYYTAGAGTLTGSTETYATPLGSKAGGNLQFQLFGIGTNNTLFTYDLLRATDDVPQAIADGVVSLHALYGLDTTGDGKLDTWADPGATGYDVSTVMTTPDTMRQIVAVHIALVMRSSTREKKEVEPEGLTYFADRSSTSGSLAREITLTADQRHYRHRIVESTIPLHNMQLLPGVAP